MKVNYTEVYPFRPIPSITPASSYWENGTWKFNMSEISAGAAYQPSFVDVILHGNTALTLVNAKADSLEYLKLFGGTEQLPSTYLDTVTLSGGCEQRNLPSEYTQVEYLESSGTQKINLGMSGNASFSIKAQATDIVSRVLVSSTAPAAAGSWVGSYNDSTYWTVGSRIYSSVTKDTVAIIEATFTGNGVVASFNGDSRTNTQTITQENWTLFINSDNTYGFIGKVWYLKGYQNNVLVRDLIPCRRNSDNVLGMYDTISGNFLTNAGTGTFTAGADVTAPTPDTPIDIVCNNGAIKVSKNLYNPATRTNGYYIGEDGVIAQGSGTFCYSALIPVKPNTNYMLSGIASQTNIRRLHAYDSNENWISQISFANTTTGYTYNITGTTPNNCAYVRISIPMLDTNVQIEQGSTATSYMPYGQIYTDGTVETVTDSNQLTASAERLLAVGNYKDTQEVLSGAVTRNVGIKVLDGTENWKASSFTEGKFFISTAVADWGVPQSTATGYCTHAVFNSTSTSYNGRVNFDLNSFCFYYSTSSTTLATFKQFLTDQYTNGTPVIVAFPLATATTDSATPQVLTKSPVTQTAGAISGLTITTTESAHTVPTPQQPLPINCNNGVLGIDSQGNITVTGTTETVEITGKNLFDKNDLYTNHYINSSGAIISTTTWDVSAKIPVIPNTQYTLSGVIQVYNNICHAFYDSNDQCLSTIATAVGTTVMTAPANASYLRLSIRKESGDKNTVQLEQGSTATTYEPYYNGGTATAENLFKVGTYQDVQSVIDGGVTRNVGVKVLDGTENFATNSGYFLLDGFSFSLPNNGGYCTHLKTASSSTALGNQDDVMRFGYTGNSSTLFIKSTRFSGVSAFKQWLASLYANGTPVIIVYPLATPTTETVTAQPMNIQAGSNIVQITQASMDDLELEVKYKAGVSVTITEIENAQLDDNVEVIING